MIIYYNILVSMIIIKLKKTSLYHHFVPVRFQNPSKPHFNHYLFESLCLSIRITCKANPATVSSFEEALFPVFTEILQNDVQGASNNDGGSSSG